MGDTDNGQFQEINLNQYAIFYPSEKGLKLMSGLLNLKYAEMPQSLRPNIDYEMSLRFTSDGGYRDYLHRIIHDFGGLFFPGTPYLDGNHNLKIEPLI